MGARNKKRQKKVPPIQHKPSYYGHFFGQSVDMGGRYTYKWVPFTKKLKPAPGHRRVAGGARPHDVATFSTTPKEITELGLIPVKSHDRWVWDGKDWITSDRFDQKFKKR